MRRALIVCLALVLCAGTVLAQQPEPTARPKSKLKGGNAIKNRATAPVVQSMGSRGSVFVKTNQWDFGHVAQNSKVMHRFELQNVGKDTLFIQKIKPT